MILRVETFAFRSSAEHNDHQQRSQHNDEKQGIVYAYHLPAFFLSLLVKQIHEAKLAPCFFEISAIDWMTEILIEW